MYSFSQRKINQWNKLSTDFVTASCVNMFKNTVDTYLRRAGYTSMTNCWTLDKPMVSLSTFKVCFIVAVVTHYHKPVLSNKYLSSTTGNVGKIHPAVCSSCTDYNCV